MSRCFMIKGNPIGRNGKSGERNGGLCHVRQSETPGAWPRSNFAASRSAGEDTSALSCPMMYYVGFPGTTPVLGQLISTHLRKGGSVIALEEVPERDTSRYGIIRGTMVEEGLFRVDDWSKSRRRGRNQAVTRSWEGTWLSPEIFRHLKASRRGAGGESS